MQWLNRLAWSFLHRSTKIVANFIVERSKTFPNFLIPGRVDLYFRLDYIQCGTDSYLVKFES